MDSWKVILLAFGGNAVLLSILGYLAKSLVNSFLAKDIKKFEADLKAKSDFTIEQLKNQLHIAAIEHQVRFSKLHETRAEVIAQLYKHLVEAIWETEGFLSLMEWAGEPSKNDKYALAMNKIVEFFRFFDQHRIYLPESACTMLDQFIKNLRSPTIQFGVYLQIEHPNQKTLTEKLDVWVKAWESVQKDVPMARQALEHEFRKILGATST